jgi:hypothetical protein
MPGVRVSDEVIPQCQRRAEHTEQPAPQTAVLDQRLVQFLPVAAQRVGQSHHRPQRDVGIGRARQRPQQLDVRVGVPAQPVQIRG